MQATSGIRVGMNKWHTSPPKERHIGHQIKDKQAGHQTY